MSFQCFISNASSDEIVIHYHVKKYNENFKNMNCALAKGDKPNLIVYKELLNDFKLLSSSSLIAILALILKLPADHLLHIRLCGFNKGTDLVELLFEFTQVLLGRLKLGISDRIGL